jgi:hypothetical protein
LLPGSGQSWCLSKAPGSYCLCQRPAWGSISNGVHCNWFGPACRPGAVALESESGTRPPARFMPFMPYKSRRLLETSGSAHSPLTQCFHKMKLPETRCDLTRQRSSRFWSTALLRSLKSRNTANAITNEFKG